MGREKYIVMGISGAAKWKMFGEWGKLQQLVCFFKILSSKIHCMGRA